MARHPHLHDHHALANTGYSSGARIGMNAEDETEVIALLDNMGIVEREEMNKVERVGAWWPSIPTREQPMPHTAVLPSHPTPTSLRPQPPRPERVRVYQPTKFTCLRSSIHNRAVWVLKASQQPAEVSEPQQPSIQNPTPPPSSHPRTSFSISSSSSSSREWAGPTSRYRNMTMYGYHPGFPSSFSSPVACALHGYTVAPPSYVSASPYIRQPFRGMYPWYGASAIGNAYTHAQMQMPIPIGMYTPGFLQLLRSLFPPELLYLLASICIAHNGRRLEQRPAGRVHDPIDRGALPHRLATHHVPHTYCSQYPSPAEETPSAEWDDRR